MAPCSAHQIDIIEKIAGLRLPDWTMCILSSSGSALISMISIRPRAQRWGHGPETTPRPVEPSREIGKRDRARCSISNGRAICRPDIPPPRRYRRPGALRFSVAGVALSRSAGEQPEVDVAFDHVSAQFSRAMLRKRRQTRGVFVGARYSRRDSAHAVWEVLATYAGVDGKEHVVLFNVADLTWQKTLSLLELVNLRSYEPLSEVRPEGEFGS